MRITTPELATVRAALKYWQEEMCPHPTAIQEPYFDDPVKDFLSPQTIEQLRESLQANAVRYAVWDPLTEKLAGLELFDSPDHLVDDSDSEVVTVL